MKTLVRLEYAGLFIFSMFLFSRLPYAWWWFPALLLAPDVSLAGYFINPRVGALVYNSVHHLAVGIAALLVKHYMHSTFVELAGTILVAHSSLDRVFGFGFKYSDSFRHTHLGNLA